MASLNIVNINASQQVASAPNTLQQTGALISLGGTNLAVGTYSLLTQLSSLTPLLAASGTAEIIAMATTFFAQGNTTPVYVLELGANAAPSALTTFITANPGVFYSYLTPKEWDALTGITAPATPTLTASTTGGTLASGTYYVKITYVSATGETLPSNEATVTVTGPTGQIAVTSPSAETGATGYNVYASLTSGAEVKQNGNTAIAIGTPYDIDALATGTASPPTINTTDPFTAMLLAYNGLSAQTYFFVTTTLTTYARYTTSMKNVLWEVTSPNAPNTEFSAAAAFFKALSYNPSSVNRMTPLAFAFLYGVTAYPLTGNQVTLTTILNNNGNFIRTGAQGGISNTILSDGTTADGNDFSYWYDFDWACIQTTEALAAAVINGANNPQAPLYYDQHGINQLLAVAQGVANNMLAFGIAQSVTVTAVPFATYVAQFPSNYAAGIYNGIAMTMTPQGGFKSLTFNVTVSNIPTT